MSEFIRFISWIFVVIGVSLVGAFVLFYYIVRCIINREDWDEEKLETDEEYDDGDNQYY